MYTEERIFGPLTFKQFLCAAAGVGLFYLISPRIPEGQVVIAGILIALATLGAIFRFKPERIGNIDEYPFTERELQKKIAEIQSQIHARKEKGFAEDPRLSEAAAQLEKRLTQSPRPPASDGSR